jgi:16S rRNA (uracil1498-N3)-methyltransferase
LEAHPDAEWARVYIGPEGGFAPEEIEAAIAAGVTPISLGPRILRTETAGLVVASLLLYHYGDMDTPPPEAWDAAEG